MWESHSWAFAKIFHISGWHHGKNLQGWSRGISFVLRGWGLHPPSNWGIPPSRLGGEFCRLERRRCCRNKTRPMEADGMPSVCGVFCGRFGVSRISWTQKQTQKKRTSDIYFLVASFSVWISWGKKQLNDNLMEWKHRRFGLETIRDQQLTFPHTGLMLR